MHQRDLMYSLFATVFIGKSQRLYDDIMNSRILFMRLSKTNPINLLKRL